MFCFLLIFGQIFGVATKKKADVSILTYARKRMKRDATSPIAIVHVENPLCYSGMAGTLVVVALLQSMNVGNGGCV